MNVKFQLEVQQVGHICNFRLKWGNADQQEFATLPYPTTVMLAYQHWRTRYYQFYNSLTPDGQESAKVSTNFPEGHNVEKSPMRAVSDGSGTGGAIFPDLRSELKHAQENFNIEFQNWLGHSKLSSIRDILTQAQFAPQSSKDSIPGTVDVFLQCHSEDGKDSLELDRLPWETWKILPKIGAILPIRFLRSPLKIAQLPTVRIERPKLRVLAILGDESGQNFLNEEKALQGLEPKIQVKFVPDSTDPKANLKQLIRQRIEDPVGWNIIFFAGHGAEEKYDGGMVKIAPNQWMMISELESSFKIAKEQGLHLAIFNCCNGLDIAKALIRIGISQVIIMREGIHGKIASMFFVEFIQRLKQQQDSHTAFLSACEYLNNISHTYPSAFLVPSLFCHPNAESISLWGWRWRAWAKQMLPGRREAIVLGSCMALSMIPAVQEFLLDGRTWAQANYRSLTKQIPPASELPILLVQIDTETIDKYVDEKTKLRQAIVDRKLAARLVDRLTASGAKVIGFDIAFEDNLPNNSILSKSVKQGFTNHGTWFIFGKGNSSKASKLIESHPHIADPKYSLSGCTDNYGIFHLKLPDPRECLSPPSIPLPYMMAISPLLQEENPSLQPSQKIVFNTIERSQSSKIHTFKKIRESHATFFSRYFEQRWFVPIIDYSIPASSAFTKISGIQILDESVKQHRILPGQIVIIASGNHLEARLEEVDSYPAPGAVKHWRRVQNLPESDVQQNITGGEHIAFSTYHFKEQRFLTPIPDMWMILLVGGVARLNQLIVSSHKRQLWIGGLIGYTSLSLQLYVVAGILIPYFLPLIVWSCYSLLHSERRNNV
jgi:CHASE2 domain